MRRSKAIAVALGAATLIAVVAWSLRSREPTGMSSNDGAAGKPVDERHSGELAAGGARHEMPGDAPRARRGGTIIGTVRRLGKPAAAHVEVRWGWSNDKFVAGHTAERTFATATRLPAPRKPDGVADAGPDGRFEIGGIEPGNVDVIAVGSDGARGISTAVVAGAGARTRVDVILAEPVPPLRGRAVYSDGRPFVGQVVVSTTPTNRQPSADEGVPSDAEGRFVVSGLAAGPHATRFVVPGEFLAYVAGPTLPREGEWNVVVDRGVGLLDGRVVDDATGAPIAGAEVLCRSSDDRRGFDARVRADNDGRFTVPSIATASRAVIAGAVGYATFSLWNVKASPLVIRLRRAATLAGTVRRADDGTAVPGATVRVLSLTVESGPSSPLAQTTTDRDGRYEVTGLPPGDVAVFAAAPGLAMGLPPEPARTGWADVATTLAPGERSTFDVSLVVGGVIAGRVIDADAAPVVDAVVTLTALEGTQADAVDHSLSARSWVAGEDGRFVADGLVPGLRATLAARAPDGRSATAAPVIPGIGEPARVEIQLPALRLIVVTVVAAKDGKPIADAWILEGEGERTDAEGRATIRIPAGAREFELSAGASGFVAAQATVQESDVVAAIRLERGYLLKGRVERATGEPVAAAWVSATKQGEGAPDTSATSTDDGTFAIDGLTDAPYVLRANATVEGVSFVGAVTARPGALALVRVSKDETGTPTGAPSTTSSERPPRFVIRVRDASGTPVFGARVVAKWDNATSWSSVSGGESYFDRESGSPVLIDVYAAHDEFGRPLNLAPGRVEVPAEQNEVILRLEPGATINGVVRAADGHPVRGVALLAVDPAQARSADRGNASESLATTRSDENGHFQLVGLPIDADLRLIVRAPAGMAPLPPLVVRSGATGLDVRLRSGVQPMIRVLDADERPVVGASVAIGPSSGAVAPEVEVRKTDVNGAVRWTTLDAESRWRIDVRDAPFNEWGGVVIDPWTPRDETIRLPRTRELAAVVVDPAGKPIAGATGTRSLLGGGLHLLPVTEADGVCSLGRVADGPLTLRVQADGFVERELTVDVGPSTETVRVVLLRGRDWQLRVEGRFSPDAEFYAYDEQKQRREPDADATVGADGLVVLRGIDPSRSYLLWSPPSENGDSYVLARSMRWTEGETRLSMTRGGSLRGSVKVPKGASGVSITAWGAPFWFSSDVAPDGDFEIRGVPPGRFALTVETRVDGEKWRGSADASAGDVVTIEMKRAD